jgi:hypothetical protein
MAYVWLVLNSGIYMHLETSLRGCLAVFTPQDVCPSSYTLLGTGSWMIDVTYPTE